MNDEKLESLLRAAGRAAVEGPSAEPLSAESGLAGRVRYLRVQRQRRRRAGVGLAAMALLGVTFWGLFHPGSPTPLADRPNPPRPSAIDVEQLKARIAAIDAEVEQRLRRVEQLRQRQRVHTELAELRNQPQPPNPLQTARMEIERTALLLVDDAEYRADFASGDVAAQQYRRVLELFPHTTAAQTARKRLETLSIEKGDL